MSEVLDKQAETAKPPAVKKQAVTLVEPRIASAEQWRQDFVVNAEEGTAVEDVLDPMYWAHVSQKFARYDRVEVRLETGEWILDLLVIDAGRNWARMHVCAKHELTQAAGGVPGEAVKYQVAYKGPQKKHCVIRIADKALIQEGLSDKQAADEWLRGYERTVG